MTDGWIGYDRLVDAGYDKYYRVNHGKNEFALGGDIHISGIESFSSFMKRRLRKFNGVKKDFEPHLKKVSLGGEKQTMKFMINLF